MNEIPFLLVIVTGLVVLTLPAWFQVFWLLFVVVGFIDARRAA